MIEKSITIKNPAFQRKNAKAKNLDRLTTNTLYSLVCALKLEIEHPNTIVFPATMVISYGGTGIAAARLLVGAWKKGTERTDDFIHGEIEIKKAKRTRIPGTNVYALGNVSKDALNIMARDYKERAKRKKLAIKRAGKSQID